MQPGKHEGRHWGNKKIKRKEKLGGEVTDLEQQIAPKSKGFVFVGVYPFSRPRQDAIYIPELTRLLVDHDDVLLLKDRDGDQRGGE